MKLRATRLTAICNAVRKLFTPADLFKLGEQGLWYDPNDFSTMFQDAAGTTPVTAVEQPVGLILDKRLGLVRGPELVVNGGFDSDAAGWTATNAVLSAVSGSLVITASGTGGAIAAQALATVAGKSYEATTTCLSAPTNGVTFSAQQVAAGSTISGVTATASGKMRLVFVAITTTTYIGVRVSNATGAGQIAEFDNISVRELPGNHATQTTSTSRPVLSARVNLLGKTEFFNDAAWSKLGTTTAPTANNLLFPAANDYTYQGLPASSVAGKLITFSVELSGSGTVTLGFYDNVSGGQFDLITLTTTPTRYYVTKTIGVGAVDVRAVIGRFGAGTATSVIANYADSRFNNSGANLPAYQRVNTATDYDTAGFPLYLKFDGIDDFLVTNSINFTGTDKMAVWAGVRKLSDVAGAILLELSSDYNSYNGSFGFVVPRSSSLNEPMLVSRGTSVSIAANSSNTTASPVSWVLTGQMAISNDLALLRINGIQYATSSGDQGAGNYGNYPIYIGRRGGIQAPFNGGIYQLIVRGAQTSAADIANGEKFTATKTGVML